MYLFKKPVSFYNTNNTLSQHFPKIFAQLLKTESWLNKKVLVASDLRGHICNK